MTCLIRMLEKPRLKKPVLVEGLPGMGFVANIAAAHMMRELGARKFALITSSSFQDFAMTMEGGMVRSPVNELYYCPEGLVILYGNTQADGRRGQYELCWEVLNLVKKMGCELVLTMGGYRRDYVAGRPRVYCAATDVGLLEKARGLCDGVVVGNIYGAAGLLLGLGKVLGMGGVCFLAETMGLYPDARAALEVLKVVSEFLELDIDLSRLEEAAFITEEIWRGSSEERGKYPF